MLLWQKSCSLPEVLTSRPGDVAEVGDERVVRGDVGDERAVVVRAVGVGAPHRADLGPRGGVAVVLVGELAVLGEPRLLREAPAREREGVLELNSPLTRYFPARANAPELRLR